MGKAKRFNSYDNDVEQQRKLVKSYGLARQSNSVSAFRSMPKSPPTATNTDNETVVVTSSTVANNSITFAKIQDIATMKVIGRTATGSGDSSEISILDEDDMASDSAVALATQQSIKAYVDANGGGSTSFSGFTADATLDMNDRNIEDVNVLKINSGSANSADSFTMFGSSTAGTINLIDDNDTFKIQVDSTSRLTISDTLITSSVPISATGIQDVGHVYLDGAGSNDLLIDGNADGLEYKVPTGDEHQFFVNNVERMVVSSTHTEFQNYINIMNPTTTQPSNTAFSGIVGWFKIKIDGGDYRMPVWNAP